jgi:hypothetical protein
MLQQALQKIQQEIGEKSKDDYVRFVGAELMKYVHENPERAGLFLAEGKTISGSLSELRKVAEKKKTGNTAVIAPDEGMAIILEYFGVPRQPVAPEPVAVGFSISVDDLL